MPTASTGRVLPPFVGLVIAVSSAATPAFAYVACNGEGRCRQPRFQFDQRYRPPPHRQRVHPKGPFDPDARGPAPGLF